MLLETCKVSWLELQQLSKCIKLCVIHGEHLLPIVVSLLDELGSIRGEAWAELAQLLFDIRLGIFDLRLRALPFQLWRRCV